MKATSTLCSVVAAASMLAPAASQAQTQYTFQKIAVPNAFWTFAADVTDDGRVSGFTTDLVHENGFTESNGAYSQVNVPGYSAVQVTAVNGTATYGVVNDNSGFSLDAAGKVTILRTSTFAALPNGVNAKGIVIGRTKVYQGNQPAFLLQNGTYQTYLAPGSSVTSFVAINNGGVIVGTSNKNGVSSFELRNGQQTAVAFPGAYSTNVTGLNDAGEMIGYYLPTSQGPSQVFLYDGKAYNTVPNAPNTVNCGTGHLNNLGQFVESCTDRQTQQVVSFLATPTASASVVLPQQ